MLKTILAAATAGFVMAAAGWNGAVWAAPASAAPPLSVYGRLPNIEQIEISPDGKKLAVAVTDGEKRMLLVREVAEGAKLLAGLNMGNTKLRDVRWAGPDHVLVTASSTADVFGLSGPKREYLMGFDYDLVTNKQRLLMNGQESSMNVILATPVVRFMDGVPHAFVEGVYFQNNRGMDMLYRVNLKTGVTRRLDYGASENTDDWLVSSEGQALAQSLYDEKQGAWSLKIKTEKGWSTVEKTVSKMGSRGLSGLGRDGRSVLV